MTDEHLQRSNTLKSEPPSDSPAKPPRSAGGVGKSGVRPKPPKKELTLDSPAVDQLQAIKGLAEHFNSDLTQVTARDNDGKLLHVAVFARGPYAPKLERWLKQIDKEDR